MQVKPLRNDLNVLVLPLPGPAMQRVSGCGIQ